MLSDLRGNFERSTSGLFSLSNTVSLEMMPPNRIVSLILKTAVDAILGLSSVTTALTTAPQYTEYTEYTELVNLQQLQVFVDSSKCRASRGSTAVFRLIARRPSSDRWVRLRAPVSRHFRPTHDRPARGAAMNSGPYGAFSSAGALGTASAAACPRAYLFRFRDRSINSSIRAWKRPERSARNASSGT